MVRHVSFKIERTKFLPVAITGIALYSLLSILFLMILFYETIDPRDSITLPEALVLVISSLHGLVYTSLIVKQKDFFMKGNVPLKSISWLAVSLLSFLSLACPPYNMPRNWLVVVTGLFNLFLAPCYAVEGPFRPYRKVIVHE